MWAMGMRRWQREKSKRAVLVQVQVEDALLLGTSYVAPTSSFVLSEGSMFMTASLRSGCQLREAEDTVIRPGVLT